jgi:hypothetical protein
MQTHPQPWLLRSAPAHVTKKQLLLIVGLLVVGVMFWVTVSVTWLFFFRTKPTEPTIDLVGTWKQEQPLGDAAGSAGWNRWFYTFSANGRFKARAERKTNNTLQDLQIDSSGRWTFNKGKLVMTFDSDGKSETVMVTRFDEKTLAIDKGPKRTFMVRVQ